MWLTVAFIITALLFAAGALSGLWHLRWVHRLPPLSTAPLGDCSASEDHTACSVVIPARDEEARIEGTVRRLLAQHDVDVEIIVVNDRGTFYPLGELRAGAVTWKSPVPACTTPVAHPAIEPGNHSPSFMAP